MRRILCDLDLSRICNSSDSESDFSDNDTQSSNSSTALEFDPFDWYTTLTMNNNEGASAPERTTPAQPIPDPDTTMLIKPTLQKSPHLTLATITRRSLD